MDEDKKLKYEDTNYVFPKLSEKEIKETIKQKDRMIYWLNKKSKDKFALIKTLIVFQAYKWDLMIA